MFEVGLAPRVPKTTSDFFSRYKPSSEEEKRVLEGAMLPMITTEEILDSVVINVLTATTANRCYRYNILYTMIETDRISPWWVECCNAMDSLWVPGPFNKESFETSGARRARIVTPGFDTDVYRPMKEGECSMNVWDRLENAPDFNFIIMGHLFHSDQDRKGIKQLIRCFARTFEGDPGVGIVLKTQLVNHTAFDQMGLMSEIGDLLKKEGRPNAIKNITIVHENYTSAEMASLYNHPKIKCFVTSTMGEGCGYCLLEASACGLPVMATNWSEHINFLPPEGFIPLPCEVRPVPEEYSAKGDTVYMKEARWAHVDDGILQDALVDFIDHPMERKAMDYSHLSLASFGKRIREAVGDDLRVERLGKAKPTRVQVASGFYPTQGYFHIDVDPVNTAQVDLISDAKNLTLDPDSVDEVLIVHLLEHLKDWEIYRVLFEAWKVLKEGGMVEVHAPDFDVAVRMFKERGRSLPLLTRATKMLLGTNDPHINLFDFERLKGFLESVGFHDVRTLETEDVYDEIAELSLGSPHRVSLCVCALKGRLPGRE